METNQAFNLICKTKSLPTPSAFAMDLAYHCYDQHASQETCSQLIVGNPKFATDLLRYVNSPLVGTAPGESIALALTTLGQETIANIAIIFSLLGQYRYGKCPHFDYQRFWQKSLARGAAARALAIQQRNDPQQFFTYGVLSTIGDLALASAFPEEYGHLLIKNFHPGKTEQKEKQLFGISTTDLTCNLLASWHLPKPLIRALRVPAYQANGEPFCRTAAKTRKILTLANHIAKICLFELPLADTFLTVEQQAEEQSLPVEQFGPFFDQLVASWQAACEFFEVPTLHCPNYHQIKTMNDVSLEVTPEKQETLTILAADDEPITLLCLEKMLSAEHRALILAKNGAEALKLALEHRPQVLITDWLMPGLSGIDLCKILRKTSVTQHMYIIMLTSNESDDELVQAFDAGADDYIIKPFTPKVLQARIASGERLIRSQQTISNDREVIRRYADKLASANRKLQNMAMTDFLTGLPNRRSALQRLRNLVSEVQRYGEPLSCLMIDIDHFKQINDTYGHDRGDAVLRQLTRLLEEKARSYDMVSRWGGEEFLVISARSGAADSCQLAERLRRSVENHEIRISDDLQIRLTISIGVATWRPDFHNAGELIKNADQALYQAKAGGRNRVEIALTSLPDPHPPR
ncbi:MAG: diguanylate cyclase [Proteobacteria bacterium]|nr:diguanylate cyclase [Pseudomonadota bacterium]